MACAAALVALALCVCAVIVFAVPKSEPQPPDLAPHEWNITRRMWLAGARGENEEVWNATFLPLRLVIVQHTAGVTCHRFADCAAAMRNLQGYYFSEYRYDVPYNYVVGNEARVYEGRGSEVVGAHTRGYNRCALGIAFTGTYHASSGGTRPTTAQMERAQTLLAAGVKAGWLHARALVLGARDVQDTESPGDALYAKLRLMPQAPEHPERFRNRNCVDIYKELGALEP